MLTMISYYCALCWSSVMVVQVNCSPESVVTSFDVAPSSQALVFGDSLGSLHLFTAGAKATFNNFPHETVSHPYPIEFSRLCNRLYVEWVEPLRGINYLTCLWDILFCIIYHHHFWSLVSCSGDARYIGPPTLHAPDGHDVLPSVLSPLLPQFGTCLRLARPIYESSIQVGLPSIYIPI